MAQDQQRVTIIGLGLIGGSIGLALRRWSSENNNALTLIGFDEDMDKQSQAKALGVVDSTEWALSRAVAEADIVIVATPVGSMPELFTDIAERLKPGAVVTDTGSTKADVLEWSKRLPTTVHFVGGHPMAGRAGSLEVADAELFHGATWVVCPSVRASESAVKTVLGIVAAVGAEAYFTDPVEHDSYVAGISHLPFVIAASLVKAASRDQSWRDMQTLSASGFKDTTRLALGNPRMHRDIVMTNKDAITRWVDQMIVTLEEVKSTIAGDDEQVREQVLAFFEEAQDTRARLEALTTRSSEQVLAGSSELSGGGLQGQMGRMFLGGFGRRKDRPSDASQGRNRSS